MKRSAGILEIEKYIENGKTKSREVWRIIENPTIGDIHSLRQRGAIIMRQIIERYGNEVHKYWVTDSGRIVVHRTDYLTCEELRRLK